MIDRRSFLILTGAAAASQAGCVVSSSVSVGGGVTAPAQPPAKPGIPSVHEEIEELGISDLAGKMARGELTSEALVAAYAARIDALDRSGPTLRSVLEVNPEAQAIAKALDDERKQKGARGPLHGVPILVKDNIDTADRMRTTAGSLALADVKVSTDATVIAKLRAAGAVILGKANLSEWANIRGDRATSGWSARGGLTRNPYALDRNTSGSSSGSAAGVAANLCAAALGTETDGSIVSPSSICGIVGVKPTVGLVSRRGVIPISASQDTVGPMTRTVTDAAILLRAVAGIDSNDLATAELASHPVPDYTKALDPSAARGKRIGVVRSFSKRIGPAAEKLFESAIAAMKSAGAEIIEDVSLGEIVAIDDPEMEVLLTELTEDMGAYLASRGGPHKSLADLVRFNQEHANEELRWFGQELFEQALKKGGRASAAYKTAIATCRKVSREEGIDAAIAKHRLDCLMAPTGGVAWVTDLVNGDSFTGSSSTPAAVAGYPSITVPAGHVEGLPFGVSFFGAAWSEATLFGVAFAFEQQTKARKRPTFRPTVG